MANDQWQPIQEVAIAGTTEDRTKTLQSWVQWSTNWDVPTDP